MTHSLLRRVADQAMLLAIVCGSGFVFQMQRSAVADEASSDEGRIVEIAPASSKDEIPAPPRPAEEPAAPAEPTYWIGVGGAPVSDPVLRTHLQLADDTGAVVEQILPGSPAEKAGLRKHDVIIAVNGQAAHGMTELVEAVRTGGGKPVELRVLRLAKEETIAVTPEPRPADLGLMEEGVANDPAQGIVAPIPGLDGGPIKAEALNDLMSRMLQGRTFPGMRQMGPGVIVPPQGLAIPNGVSISVQRQNDQPAQITVTRGDESWTVSEGDEAALEKLPADVRQMVDRMLGKNGMGGGVLQFQFNGDELLPDVLGRLTEDGQIEKLQQQAVAAAEAALERSEQIRARAEQARARAEQGEQLMLQRLEQMEQRLKDVQEQLRDMPAPPAPPKPQTDDKTT